MTHRPRRPYNWGTGSRHNGPCGETPNVRTLSLLVKFANGVFKFFWRGEGGLESPILMDMLQQTSIGPYLCIVHPINMADVIDKSNLPENTGLFRYMDFPKFCRMLQRQELYFTRLDKFRDQNEGIIHPDNREWVKDLPIIRLFGPPLTAEEAATDSAAKISEFRSQNLANCWSIAESEDYLMWRAYLDGANNGVAVQTNLSNLKRVFQETHEVNNIKFRKVSYETKLENFDLESVFTSKRPAYRNEHELRLLISGQQQVNPDLKYRIALDVRPGHSGHEVRDVFIPKYEHGVGILINLKDLITTIYISPMADSWFYEVAKNVLDGYLPGHKINICNSAIIER
jgi:hypothetical protein